MGRIVLGGMWRQPYHSRLKRLRQGAPTAGCVASPLARVIARCALPHGHAARGSRPTNTSAVLLAVSQCRCARATAASASTVLPSSLRVGCASAMRVARTMLVICASKARPACCRKSLQRLMDGKRVHSLALRNCKVKCSRRRCTERCALEVLLKLEMQLLSEFAQFKMYNFILCG